MAGRRSEDWRQGLTRYLHLESVNVGRPTHLSNGRFNRQTGIYKRPVDGPVKITRLGAEGDAVMEKEYHGGPGQALYLYSIDDYAWWAEQGVDAGPGVFGDNLTVSGVGTANLCIGDRLARDTLELEVTASRTPCATLAARMGDAGFVRRFRDAGRPGAYLRVLKEGTVEAGQDLLLTPFAGDRVTLGQHLALTFSAMKSPLPRQVIERLLALPLSEREREYNLERLRRLTGP